MTSVHDPGSRAPGAVRDGGQRRHAGHAGHGWMMIACCVPMLVIALALLAAGVVSARFLVAALACAAMMAFMMAGMSRDRGEH